MQNTMMARRSDCRLCGSTRHELILQLKPSPIADAYVLPSHADRVQPSFPLDLFLCLDCGHAQLLDVINPEILYRDYIYVTTSSLGLSEHFQRYAESVLQKVAPPPGSLV